MFCSHSANRLLEGKCKISYPFAETANG